MKKESVSNTIHVQHSIDYLFPLVSTIIISLRIQKVVPLMFTGFQEEYRNYRALEQFDCAKNICIFLEIILSIETTKRF